MKTLKMRVSFVGKDIETESTFTLAAFKLLAKECDFGEGLSMVKLF